ncbi:TPA: hypothetical protein DDW35_10265 [Candidatus Sumerlaeota bacterium]|nr:hypothetical protein [Candidatus Sumerlaeota bacterium]
MTFLSSTDFQSAQFAIGQCCLEKAREILSPFAQALLEIDAPLEMSLSLHFWRDTANLLRDAGMIDVAVKAFEAARSAGMGNDVTELELGATWLAAGEYAKALEHLTPLTVSNTQNAVARNLRAIALFESGDRQTALAEWKACGKMAGRYRYPFCTEPFHLALAAMGIEHFLGTQARQMPPELPSAQPCSAPGMTVKARLEHIDQAVQQRHFQDALAWIAFEKTQPKAQLATLSFLHAVALGEMNQWQQARQEILPALEGNSSEPLAWSFYAYTLIQCGDAESALRILDHVMPVGPDDYFSTYFRGCACLAQGKRDSALCHFQLAFCHYFFDTSEMVLLPAWEKVRAILTPKENA